MTAGRARFRLRKLQQRVARLEKELAAERNLRKALAKLSLHTQQDPKQVKLVRKFLTIHRKTTT